MKKIAGVVMKKTFFREVLHQAQERLPKAIDIEQEDGFVMKSELPPCDDFKSFIKSAQTTWQDAKGV